MTDEFLFLLLIAFLAGLWLGIVLRDYSHKSKKGHIRVARGLAGTEPPTPQPGHHKNQTHNEHEER